jgi:hypothetical protein
MCPMLFLSLLFSITHILFITLERVVMKHMEFYFVGGWMECLLSSSVEA